MDLSNYTKGQLERLYAIQLAPVQKEISELKKEIKELRDIISNTKPLYTIDEVASFFNISKQTIYNWEKDKKLIRHKIKGRVYFRKEDLDKLVNYSKI